MSKNVPHVEAIYAAFGRGDVPAILEHLSDDVAWEYQPISTTVPWLQGRRGKEGALAFFQAVGSELAISKFTVNRLLAADQLVVALVDLEGTVKKTGRAIHEVDEVHLWHFDERGRVARFRHCVDTHQHWLAWKDQA
jgi:ketosteroid isomerase-like protein